jgi:hypothetical protein
MSYNLSPDPKSWLDPLGTLLQSNDDKWIYRALTKEGEKLLQFINKQVGFAQLHEIGLIRTEMVDENIDDDRFQVIVRHKRVHPVIYPQEWTIKMWKDALAMFCDLTINAKKLGLSIHDAHPYNILFDYGKPKFIDFGSLRILSKNNIPVRWHIEFKKYFILPILVHTFGFKKLAEYVIHEPNEGTFTQYYYFTPFVIPMLLVDLAYIAALVTKQWSFYLKTVKSLAQINIIPTIKTRWANYRSSTGNWKENAVKEAFTYCEPFATVFDIGGNKGTYTYDLAMNKKQVIVADIDEKSLEVLRKKAVADKLQIATIKLDICHPTPRLGLGLFKENAFDRYASDVVVALAISHHLAFFNKLPFHAFSKILHDFSKKYILTEFVSLDDPHVIKWRKKKRKYPPLYSREHFIEAFENESFTPVHEWANEIKTRYIYLFKKNDE